MAKTKSSIKKSGPESMTGTYRYDRELGEIVLVSAKTPKVASKARQALRGRKLRRRGRLSA